MNILIPMAGRSSRFSGIYDCPKPLIKIFDKPMIELAVKSLRLDGQLIFCVLQEHIDNSSITDTLQLLFPDCLIVPIKEVLEGSVCTCLKASDIIDTDEELVIANCDQFMAWDPTLFRNTIDNSDAEGILVCYPCTKDTDSYVRLNSAGEITEVREKERISGLATNGIHYWRKGSYFVDSAQEMIAADDRVNGEFYIAPTYNYLVKAGKHVVPHIIEPEEHYAIGIPADLDKFKETMQWTFHSWMRA